MTTTSHAPSWVTALAEEGFGQLDARGGRLRAFVHDDRRNSDLYWCTSEGGQKVLVKRGRNWVETTAPELYASLLRLRARLHERGDPAVAPAPLAWSASPPGLCMTVVDGLPAKRLMRGEIETMSDAVRSGMAHDRLMALARLSGTALGWYHDVHRDDVDDDAVVEAQRAFDNLRSTRLLRRVRAVAPAIAADDVTFSWNDFGFHNVLVTPDERVCLLDTPPAAEPRVIHRDVARALAEVAERYRARHGPWIPRHLRPAVADAFLEGYSSVSGRDVTSPDDQLLLRYHETQAKIRRARRKVQARDWVEALPAVGVALQAYRNLRQ